MSAFGCAQNVGGNKMHEQSETIKKNGKWQNVYGKNLPKAGQQLPGTKDYASVEEAVAAAKARSQSFDAGHGHAPEGKINMDELLQNHFRMLGQQSGVSPEQQQTQMYNSGHFKAAKDRQSVWGNKNADAMFDVIDAEEKSSLQRQVEQFAPQASPQQAEPSLQWSAEEKRQRLGIGSLGQKFQKAPDMENELPTESEAQIKKRLKL
jgi:hypothetical protein